MGHLRASHILVKHQGSRRTASWKDLQGEEIKTRTKVAKTCSAALRLMFAIVTPRALFVRDREQASDDFE